MGVVNRAKVSKVREGKSESSTKMRKLARNTKMRKSSLAQRSQKREEFVGQGAKRESVGQAWPKKVVIREGSQNEKRIGHLGPEARSG